MGFDRTRLPDPATYFESQSLKLTGPRSAKWKTGACQFHGGSDSLRVNVSSGAWVCMACGAKGGDVLAYHMQAHCVEFVDAARQLGAWIDDDKPTPVQKPAPLPPRAGCLAGHATALFRAARFAATDGPFDRGSG